MLRTNTVGSVLHTSRVIIAAATASAAVCPLHADVSINFYNSASSFHTKRVGIPDQDQKRVGLPNNGACHCVPTSIMNLFMYAANHGYPVVPPGSGSWGGYDTYYDVTDHIDDFGVMLDVSPGGIDPDCTDPPRDCPSLPCGTGYGISEIKDWLGAAADDFVVLSNSSAGASTTSLVNVSKLAVSGSVLAVGYGRYYIVAYDGPNPIFRRKGGHSITFTEGSVLAGVRTLSTRDPGDDGDVFGPSAYAYRVFNPVEVTVLRTTETGDILLSWGPITRDRIVPPAADGSLRLLDAYVSLRPLSGFTWVGPQISELPIQSNWGGEPLHATAVTTMIDVVPDFHSTGYLALTTNAVTTLMHIDPLEGTSTTLATVPGAARLALGPKGDLFVLHQNKVERRDAETGQLIDQATLSGAFGIPSEIAVDPATDRAVILFKAATGAGGAIQTWPRDLDSTTELPTTHQIPGSVNLPGTLDMAIVPPGSDAALPSGCWLWVSVGGANAARGMRVHPSSGAMMVVETLPAAALDAPTSIDFGDRGRMYVVSQSRVGRYVATFDRSSTGVWSQVAEPALQGVVPGPDFFVHRSRTNVDPSLFQTSQWENFPNDEYEEFGVLVPDCLADLNNDGTVDGADLGALLGQWNTNGSADFNGDDVVDGADLGTLLGAWGVCRT